MLYKLLRKHNNSYCIHSLCVPSAAVALVSGPQPCEGTFVFTCTASEDTPQMRVSVQSLTQALPVERTVNSLYHDSSYDVELDRVRDDPNIAVRLSVTIREVSDHIGTKYHCVQHHDDGTIRSQELVISEWISFLVIKWVLGPGGSFDNCIMYCSDSSVLCSQDMQSVSHVRTGACDFY